MSYLVPLPFPLKSTERIGQGVIPGESRISRWHSFYNVSIDTIDDDSLLNIFLLCRPPILDGDEDDNVRILGGRSWVRDRWWYKLAQVCRRWRDVILQSPVHLGLSLLCTCGTPVAEMLAYSPPLPIVIDYSERYWDITAEEEKGIILALEKRDRVCRVRLQMAAPNMQKLMMAIDEEYPMLEHLIIVPSTEDNSTALSLPLTFRAPRLRHLTLRGLFLPIKSQLLSSAVDVASLCLIMDHPSIYFQPNTLLQWISIMPHLEMLMVAFSFPVPNHDVRRQLMHTSIMTHVTFPNLRSFVFRGVSTYLEAVVYRVTTPRLEKLDIQFPQQLTFSVPRLAQFMSTTMNLKFGCAKFKFASDEVHVKVYPSEEVEMYAFSTVVRCWHLDWQVSSMAQIFNSLSQIFSMVEHLTLEHEVHGRSSAEYNEVDRIEWRRFLRSFSNVKTLRFDNGLVKGLSCCLRLDDGELPLELLPELQELTYSGSGDTGDAFASFIEARQNAGSPVTLREAERLFVKQPKGSYSNLGHTQSSLLSQLMNPDPKQPKGSYSNMGRTQSSLLSHPNIFPPGHRLASTHRTTDIHRTPPSGKSFATLPLAAQVTAQAPILPAVTSNHGGYRPKGRPQGEELEDESDSPDDSDDIIQFSHSSALQRLAALATKPSRRQAIFPTTQTSAITVTAAPIPLNHPWNLPAPAPPTAPRTTRRQMLATEVSESLRRNLLWERQVSKSNLLGNARRRNGLGDSGSSLVTTVVDENGNTPAVTLQRQRQRQQHRQQQGEGSSGRGQESIAEGRQRALARNRTWADDFQYTGW